MLDQIIAMVLLTVLLVWAGIIDWRTTRIPNWLTLPAMGIGMFYWLVVGLWTGEPGHLLDLGTSSVLALLAGLVPMTVLYASGGLGGGDVKLVAAVGAISGQWQCVLATGFYALIFAGLLALCLMIRRRIVFQTLGRLFGAALQVAARVKPDLTPEPASPKIAFGAAVCMGGLLAGVEFLLGVSLPWSAIGP